MLFMYSKLYLMVCLMLLNKALCLSSSKPTLKRNKSFSPILGCFMPSNYEDVLFDEDESKLSEDESEKNLCILCCDEKKTVTLNCCGNSIGNLCSNILIQSEKPCPYCRHLIRDFKGINIMTEVALKEFLNKDYYTTNPACELKLDDFKNLMKRVKCENFNPVEIIARLKYLMRGQQPDDKLLKDIDSLLSVRKHIQLRQYIEHVFKNCLIPKAEFELYKKHFKRILSMKENFMLKRYYKRNNLDVKKEFLRRNQYFDNIVEE
ncbi:uncharacterized protein LOC126904392 isoform X2 [Daktulosphaira vitifoliae]|uniref:uncharacterized protein LOC126904392 isoform X2 n=1 Tax=Daktulosphaira vitifoliae TaxID=58002 RepID=UPI0021AA5348|nr:uncharacterized protein LOC126904392 isoform X2 [Daktulosphaira vitifoliae]